MSKFCKIYDRFVNEPHIFNTSSKLHKMFMYVNLSLMIVQLDNNYVYSLAFTYLIPCPQLRGNAQLTLSLKIGLMRVTKLHKKSINKIYDIILTLCSASVYFSS